MSGARLVVVVAAALMAAATAFAQQRPPAEAKSFERVSVRLPPALADPSFAAFRHTLAAVAKGRVFEDLVRNVVPRGFFWDGDFANRFDAKKTGAENLAAAIRLEEGAGTGWQMLADFAAEPTATEIPAAPGVLCAPGRPLFNRDDFDRLVDATRSSPADWAFPRAEGLDLHAAPRPESAVVEKVGGHFLRVIRFNTAAANADPLHTSWARVAAPSGKIGYAAPGTLQSVATPQLCYMKDITGRWRISGFIGAAD